MIILVAKQIGMYVISTSVGLAIGGYGRKYVGDNAVFIISSILSGGL